MEVLARGVRIESYGCGRNVYGDEKVLEELLSVLAHAAGVMTYDIYIKSGKDGVRGTLLGEEGMCTLFTSISDKYLSIDSLFTGIKEEKLGRMLGAFKEQVQCRTMTHELIARGVRLGDGDPGACILSEREW